MKKQIVKKIILNGTILVFSLSLLVNIFPLTANAVGTGLNWENPNKNGDNPYKLSTDAILNSQTLMQVVGCTGVVNAVSGAIADFVKDQTLSILKSATTKAVEKATEKSCDVAKNAVVAPTGTIPQVTISSTLIDSIKCPDVIKVSNTEQSESDKEMQKKKDATERREACFNGLAYTLAKNQLTSMTRETLNWVNSGFSGNPLYVQNMRSLTNSIERNVIESGINTLANGAFPYSGDFSKTLIRSYNGGSMNAASNYLESLTSDLSAFLTDKDSYGVGNTYETLDAKARAIADNNRFANDFSVGGWDGYMALTQRDQNNPLGFTMQASQYLADRINQQSNETKDEISQNNGFLSQKECIKWQLYGSDGKPLQTGGVENSTVSNGVISGLTRVDYKYSDNKSNTTPNYDKCVDWKVTTPGSIIKDKLTFYVNSPERQLELADDINSSLSSLFTKLIENFRSEGLFWLSQEKYSAVDDMIGYGVNGTGIDGALNSGYSSPTYSTGYSNESFSLTRDLGNTYIHGEVSNLGTWDAKNNIATYHNGTMELNVDLGVYNEISKGYEPGYYYFTVTNPGNTKLFNNGYNQWNYQDRVFWNGTSWQNWKCEELKVNRDTTTKNITSTECLRRGSPIDVRGIIQVQKDYVTAAKEILKKLPSVMPKLGELDYCIPGPNPNFEMNSSETGTAFNEFAGTLNGTWNPGAFLARNSTTITIATKGTEKYDNYAKIFINPEVKMNGVALFSEPSGMIQLSQPWKELHGSFLGTSANNRIEEKNQTAVDKVLQKIQNDIKSFYSQYKEQIFDGRFGTMRSEFTEIENSAEQVVNTDYVPMIEDGYAATKDIVTRAEEIIEETADYNSSIILAQSNTAKLNIIKTAVSKIVKDAQDRRDNNLVFQEKVKEFFKETDWTKAKALYETYKKDNQSCFNEENLSYYEDGSTVPDEEEDAGRCFDSLDNDLDGLIDALDPDCKDIKNEDTTPLTNLNLPIITARANPAVISLGGATSTITWSSSNTASCKNTENSDTGTSGSFMVKPITTTTYEITCIDKNDKDKKIVKNVIVKVNTINTGTKGITLPTLTQD